MHFWENLEKANSFVSFSAPTALDLYTHTMGKKDKKEEVDDKFDVLAEITDMHVDEEEKARLAEKAEKKKLKKAITKEEREAQRKINRESREKKKLKKELNKKRKVNTLYHSNENDISLKQ